MYHRSKGPFCTPSSCTKREMGCGPIWGCAEWNSTLKTGLPKTMRCPCARWAMHKALAQLDGPKWPNPVFSLKL